ncbi:NmrA family NAD(P)-binding protein [Croceibacterium ferulae]|uniref:NmrA family NAD(P)-binding protein n=1 Tax=Croceibacterium ferulae TaxID=1854641 RepID=UPI000EAD5571|nr:NmrA family NAD(P)-binding protein [Croceibacterium ferulae]
MATEKFLVTGATGETGRPAISKLLALGHQVRAMAHREDERAQALRDLGAEVIIADMLNAADMIAAAQGVTGAYFCFPVLPGLVQATTYMADAAKQASLKVVVNLSQIAARSDVENQIIRDHWVAERVLDLSGVPTVHLRPTFYLQWLLYGHSQASIIRDRVIDLPWGEGRHAPIAPEDIGTFAAAVLDAPAVHIGKTYDLHGPIELNEAEIAVAVSEALGVNITYRPLSIEAYVAQLQAMGFPPFVIDFFCAVAADGRDGIFSGTNRVFETVTGAEPMTVQQFVRLHRAEFAI